MEEVKTCCRCQQQKELTQFVASKVHADGYKAFCKECHAEANKKWRKNNKPLNRTIQKALYWKNKAVALEQQLNNNLPF
jgi:hypothetical protein